MRLARAPRRVTALRRLGRRRRRDRLAARRRIGTSARPGRRQFGRCTSERLPVYEAVARAEGGRRRRRGRPVGARDRLLERSAIRSTAALIADETCPAAPRARGFARPSPPMSSRAARRRRRWPSSSALWSELAIGRDGVDRRASAAARRRTSPASWRRRTCAAFAGSLSRRRSSAWSTRRSAARRRSTSDEGKNLAGRVPLAAARVHRPDVPARDAAARGAPGRDGRGRQDGPARRASALWELPEEELIRALRRVQGRGRASATRTSARRGGRSSTSATRSRTRSRPDPATSCGTATRSRSACSRRCASPADRPTSSRTCSRPSRCAVDRDRAWDALLRDKKGSGVSSCCSATAAGS